MFSSERINPSRAVLSNPIQARSGTAPASGPERSEAHRLLHQQHYDQCDYDAARGNGCRGRVEVPERALLRAEEVDVFALSAAVDGEIAGVLNRPRFAHAIPLARRERVLEILRRAAVWFEPTVPVADCRDPKLALAAGAETIVSSDDDLLVLHPWRGVRILLPADYLAAT
jgi:uncharacterized protein